MSTSEETSADLICHRCGYDLRAHPAEGKCPECGESVAESERMAAIPRRPAWRNSDPRWRRRMLAGVWMLVLLPLMATFMSFESIASITVWNLFGFRGALRLDDTFINSWSVFETLVFCMGLTLLFSRERHRRLAHLDWTRRWGILCGYVVLLLGSSTVLYILALVTAGIGALLNSIPMKYTPAVTPYFVAFGTNYLWYGPFPKDMAIPVQAAFASIGMLLGCVPLHHALRSAGLRRIAIIVVMPLALLSLIQLAQVAWFSMNHLILRTVSLDLFFEPRAFVQYIRELYWTWPPTGARFLELAMEASKWCSVFAIAIWLSIAQVSAWFHRKRPHSQQLEDQTNMHPTDSKP